MKICLKCNAETLLQNFSNCKNCKDGKDNICKKCKYLSRNRDKEKVQRKKIYANLKDNNPEKYKSYLQDKKEYRSNNKERYLFLSCRKRATIENIPFNIDITDIIIPEYCPILECKIINLEDNHNLYGPSVDKIDPSLGYIKGNVQVISRKANMMKLNANRKELENFSKNILKYLK